MLPINLNLLSKQMLFQFIFLLNFTALNSCTEAKEANIFSMKNNAMEYSKLAQDFLYAVKTEDSTSTYELALANASLSKLISELDTDSKKLAFWLNLYNAFVQKRLRENPELYKDRNKFYKADNYTVAGEKLSLDMIEHGILRHSKNKISLGYFNKWFPNSFEKKTRVAKVDARIHFALNCGAKSCPPIRFYEAEKIDKQLDLATKVYLQNEVKYEAINNKVFVPALFSWFRGDFGGKKGIKTFLKKYELIPKESSPSLVFQKYNWNLDLKNFDKSE